MDQSSITVFVVDAFTNELFSGNPAAVCCLERVSGFPELLGYRSLHFYVPKLF